MKPLVFPPVERPLLSVVMVTYGGWEWPRRALSALLEHTDVPFEVVIVDNDSPDETGARLQEEVRGARLLLNPTNLGFGPAANLGAMVARGRLLCFLNPDALVQPGWLPPLLQALESSPKAGAVVPRFLTLDGSVDEAGSVVDRSARTHAYGRGLQADDPRVRFPRVIDYGSAACLVIPAWAFRRAGGFDPAFQPAYCEDVDLLLSLRSAGFLTLYEPRSTVVHAGAGSTDDVVRGALIERNRPLLLSRWREELAGRPSLLELDRFPHRAVALRDVRITDRILAVVEDGAGPIAAWAVAVAEACPSARVTIVSPEPFPRAEELLAGGIEAVSTSEPEALLADRVLHYTAVVLEGPRVAASLEGLLRRGHPEVFRIYAAAEELDPVTHPRGATGWRGSEVSAMRGATAILCRTETQRRTAELMAPGVPTFLLDDPRTLEAVLSSVGILPERLVLAALRR